MKHSLKILAAIFRSRVSRLTIYRFNFWTAAFVDGSLFLIQLLTFNAIFSEIETIGGWGLSHMAIFVGTFTILDAVYMGTYFFGVLSLPEKIRTGRLDLYLTKPTNALFLLSFEQMDFGSVILTIPGIVMVIWGAVRLPSPVTVWMALGYVIFLVAMYVLMFFLMVLLRIPAFWFTRLTVFNHIEDALVEFSYRVPGVIYKGVWKFILYILLPYGLMATLPTQMLAGEVRWTHWGLVFGVLVAFWLLTGAIWHRGLSRYNSASS